MYARLKGSDAPRKCEPKRSSRLGGRTSMIDPRSHRRGRYPKSGQRAPLMASHERRVRVSLVALRVLQRLDVVAERPDRPDFGHDQSRR
jgi:hypothetical protein